MDLYGASYANINDSPLIGRALSEWVDENYSPDHMVMGTIALDAERRILDVRVYLESTGPTPEQTNTPHGDGKEAWDDLVDWLTGLGATAGVSFARRPRVSRMHGKPLPFDMVLSGDHQRRYPTIGMSYVGHLIVDGTDVAFILSTDDDQSRQQLTDYLTEKLGQRGDIDPVILDALAIARKGDPSGDDDLKTLNDAIDKLSAIIAEGPQQGPPSPFDLPPIRKDDDRPDVPGAFYN